MLAEIFVLRLEAQLRAQEGSTVVERNVSTSFGANLSAHVEKMAEPEAQNGALTRDLLEDMQLF
jgi:hypothetical protein